MCCPASAATRGLSGSGRAWPGQAIAPDVGEPACAAQLRGPERARGVADRRLTLLGVLVIRAGGELPQDPTRCASNRARDSTAGSWPGAARRLPARCRHPPCRETSSRLWPGNFGLGAASGAGHQRLQRRVAPGQQADVPEELPDVRRPPAGGGVPSWRGAVAGHSGEGVVAHRDVVEPDAGLPERVQVGVEEPDRVPDQLVEVGREPGPVGRPSLVPPIM